VFIITINVKANVLNSKHTQIINQLFDRKQRIGEALRMSRTCITKHQKNKKLQRRLDEEEEKRKGALNETKMLKQSNVD